MEATTPGQNRTGAALNPSDIKLMLEAVQDLSPPIPINTAQIDTERLSYIADADSVGSIPPPAALLKGAVKKGIAKLNGVSPNMFLDKLGERIAFERSGTRLYDALISKYLALGNGAGELLPTAESVLDETDAAMEGAAAVVEGTAKSNEALAMASGETALATLRRIRAEELGHFRMLCEVAEQLGADPTAQTPCADVAATASMGILQVITDPRTTLAQCLNALLTAELTDNAGWELLGQLATEAGQAGMADLFLQALEAEQQHAAIVKGWLQALVIDAVGTAAV